MVRPRRVNIPTIRLKTTFHVCGCQKSIDYDQSLSEREGNAAKRWDWVNLTYEYMSITDKKIEIQLLLGQEVVKQYSFDIK